MNLEVMEALGVRKAFVFGESQGGWFTVRMALLAPDRIEGIIPLGTSLDFESDCTRKLGCWDGAAATTPSIEAWTTNEPNQQFEPDDYFCNVVIDNCFGKDCDSSVRGFWKKTIRGDYQSDDGRRRARMATINLRDRDGLHGRLFDVRCPVTWLRGSCPQANGPVHYHLLNLAVLAARDKTDFSIRHSDAVYSVENAEQEIEMFINSPDTQSITIKDDLHLLSASHPKEVDEALISFEKKWHEE